LETNDVAGTSRIRARESQLGGAGKGGINRNSGMGEEDRESCQEMLASLCTEKNGRGGAGS